MSEEIEDPAEDATPQFEFDEAFQHKVATLILRDSQFAARTVDLVQPDYFTEAAVGTVVRIAQDFVRTYKSAPDIKVLPTLLKDEIAKKRIRPDMVDDVKKVLREILQAKNDLGSSGFVLDKVRDFAKSTAIEQAMLQILETDMIGKKAWSDIDKIMKKAQAVGNVEDSGDYDYFKEIDNRTKRREDFNAGKIVKRGITTGYSSLDAYMFHMGWGRKELSVMMGPAKAGKSMSLADFGKNAALAGYNVLYDSYEVSKDIIAERLDANLADVLMRELHKDPDEVRKLIRAAEAKSGKFKIRETATGTRKPSALARLIEDYKADGIIFDLILPDYADIMAAEYRSDNEIANSRSIYIDLRAIAFENDLAMVTATQTNRKGAEAITAKATDVAEDFNKIRTADLVLSINANEQEKIDGEARLFFAAARNGESEFTLRIKQDRAKMKFITKIVGRE